MLIYRHAFFVMFLYFPNETQKIVSSINYMSRDAKYCVSTLKILKSD